MTNSKVSILFCAVLLSFAAKAHAGDSETVEVGTRQPKLWQSFADHGKPDERRLHGN
jgi:hypothetical protein